MIYKDFHLITYSFHNTFGNIFIHSLTLLIMALKSKENVVGAWTFLIGVILAVGIGVFTTLLPIPALTAYSPQIYAILVLIGMTIGFLNVTGKDSQTFLMAGAVLIIVSKFGLESVTGTIIGIGVGDAVASVFGALIALFAPATIIVALKTVFSIAKV